MPRITEMFAFIVADTGPDDEGVPAMSIGGMHMPLCGADLKRIEQLRPYAANIARALKKPVRLVRFGAMEELETVSPRGEWKKSLL